MDSVRGQAFLDWMSAVASPTADLINAAKAADAAKTQTVTTLATATDADTHAGLDQASAHAAVFTDLTTNGQALYVDTSVTPQVYYVAAPVAPADFSLTTIGLA